MQGKARSSPNCIELPQPALRSEDWGSDFEQVRMGAPPANLAVAEWGSEEITSLPQPTETGGDEQPRCSTCVVSRVASGLVCRFEAQSSRRQAALCLL